VGFLVIYIAGSELNTTSGTRAQQEIGLAEFQMELGVAPLLVLHRWFSDYGGR
jgi:hypothetical protein